MEVVNKYKISRTPFSDWVKMEQIIKMIKSEPAING